MTKAFSPGTLKVNASLANSQDNIECVTDSGSPQSEMESPEWFAASRLPLGSWKVSSKATFPTIRLRKCDTPGRNSNNDEKETSVPETSLVTRALFLDKENNQGMSGRMAKFQASNRRRASSVDRDERMLMTPVVRLVDVAKTPDKSNNFDTAPNNADCVAGQNTQNRGISERSCRASSVSKDERGKTQLREPVVKLVDLKENFVQTPSRSPFRGIMSPIHGCSDSDEGEPVVIKSSKLPAPSSVDGRILMTPVVKLTDISKTSGVPVAKGVSRSTSDIPETPRTSVDKDVQIVPVVKLIDLKESMKEVELAKKSSVSLSYESCLRSTSSSIHEKDFSQKGHVNLLIPLAGSPSTPSCGASPAPLGSSVPKQTVTDLSAKPKQYSTPKPLSKKLRMSTSNSPQLLLSPSLTVSLTRCDDILNTPNGAILPVTKKSHKNPRTTESASKICNEDLMNKKEKRKLVTFLSVSIYYIKHFRGQNKAINHWKYEQY